MLKSQLRFIGAGDDSHLCVFESPVDLIHDALTGACLAIPVLSREGGLLLAVPDEYFLPSALSEAVESTDDALLLGPSRSFTGALLEEDEMGAEMKVDLPTPFLVIDVADSAIQALREYDPLSDPLESIQPYSADRPSAIVDVKTCMPDVLTWLETVGGGHRLNFYSAREEQDALPVSPKPPAKKAGATAKKVTTAVLAQQVAELSTQLRALATQQQAMMEGAKPSIAAPARELPMAAGVAAKLPPVSSGLGLQDVGAVPKIASLLGPPPRAKAPALPARSAMPEDTGEVLEDHQDPSEPASGVARAILQQSAALNSLVAHLTSSDPIADLTSASSSGVNLSTKGAAKREKMQAELAAGTSQFFLQLQQQLYRRMHPTRTVPKTEEDLLGAGVTMTSYLERYGGYRNKGNHAMIMWMLAHIADSASQGDYHKTKEYLALTIAAMEQASLDGHWGIAYLIGLLEEPPAQVYADRQTAVTAVGRPFAPLIPAQWSAVALSYLKEIEILTTKKTEVRNPKVPQPKPDPATPKRAINRLHQHDKPEVMGGRPPWPCMDSAAPDNFK